MTMVENRPSVAISGVWRPTSFINGIVRDAKTFQPPTSCLSPNCSPTKTANFGSLCSSSISLHKLEKSHAHTNSNSQTQVRVFRAQKHRCLAEVLFFLIPAFDSKLQPLRVQFSVFLTLGPLVSVVIDKPEETSPGEVRCVREDRTETCETRDRILAIDSKLFGGQFQYQYLDSDEELEVACLKNFDSSLHAMPNLNQIHSLIEHYGPTVFFHRDEVYLPSSAGNIDSAELYVYVKPTLGGTFTDIAMLVSCPFNGPSTIKIGLVSIAMNKIGEQVGDWEHFTLRVNSFMGEVWQVTQRWQMEPWWLQYMRDWGPTIVYDGRWELDKLIDRLRFFVRFSVENLIELFPTQLYGEEGPSGPEEKDNWLGDERC
ncbi:hypothetical protein C1H46_011911 [Malus baccata]|uniref:Uncharacterized protein n=1 Tax=Malus baccata TaxID=106549 RepID=A0A540MW74_MALBA|nr:hypothetical protein C1H46_011911 [Malus baccata]